MEDCPREILITTHNRAMDRVSEVPGRTIEDIHSQTEIVEWATGLDDHLGRCKTCEGLVVDLSSGKLYCGLSVPPEVVASNERILQN